MTNRKTLTAAELWYAMNVECKVPSTDKDREEAAIQFDEWIADQSAPELVRESWEARVKVLNDFYNA